MENGKENYAILRIKKMKSTLKSSTFNKKADTKKTTIFKALKHNLRLYDVVNADNNNTIKNKVIVGSENLDDLILNIDNYTNENASNIKSNSVFAFEVVQTATKFDSEKQKQEFIKRSVEFLNEKFGEANVKSVILHEDETTPHLHSIVIPIVDKKLNARQLTGGYNGAQKLRKLQDEYAQSLDSLGFKRGKKREKKEERIKHKTLKQFYSLENKMIKAYKSGNKIKIDFKKFNIKKVLSEIEDKKLFESKDNFKERVTNALKTEFENYINNYLNNLNALFNAKAAINEEKEKELKKQKKELEEKEKKIKNEIEKEVEKEKVKIADNANEQLRNFYNKKDLEIEEIKEENEMLKKENLELNEKFKLDKDELNELRKLSAESINNYMLENKLIKYKERIKKSESVFDFVKRVANVDFYSAQIICAEVYETEIIKNKNLEQKANAYAYKM